MKINKLIFLFFIFLLLVSCSTSRWNESLVSTGNMDVVVENVIIDFIHTAKLAKNNSVFNVSLIDIDQDILMIGITIPSDVIHPSCKNKVGTYDDVFPTQFIIKENKLFYWNDSTVAITQEIIDVLKRYNHIDFSWVDLPYEMIYVVHDDGIEGIVYFICKKNYNNYKKTGISNIAKQYINPKLKCH